MDYCADEAVTVPDVFVTGTGRCGSTLVSALLSEPQEFLTASLRIGVFDSEFLYLQRPDRLGRLACVERSAGSVSVAGLLAARFPAAKFIHIARDGRDCAVSMSRHPNFRLAYVHAQLRRQLGYDPFTARPSRTSWHDLPAAEIAA